MNEIHLATGIAYSTVHVAQKRRVRVDVAEQLVAFANGALKLDDVRIPKRTVKRRKLKRARAA